MKASIEVLVRRDIRRDDGKGFLVYAAGDVVRLKTFSEVEAFVATKGASITSPPA